MILLLALYLPSGVGETTLLSFSVVVLTYTPGSQKGADLRTHPRSVQEQLAPKRDASALQQQEMSAAHAAWRLLML